MHTLVIDKVTLNIYTVRENPIGLSHFSTGTVVNHLEILLVEWNE